MARIDKTIKFASNIETAVMITDNLTHNLLRTIEKLSKNEPSSKLTKHDYDVNPVSSGKALEDNNVLPCHVLFTFHNVKPAVNTTASQNLTATNTTRMHGQPCGSRRIRAYGQNDACVIAGNA